MKWEVLGLSVSVSGHKDPPDTMNPLTVIRWGEQSAWWHCFDLSETYWWTFQCYKYGNWGKGQRWLWPIQEKHQIGASERMGVCAFSAVLVEFLPGFEIWKPWGGLKDGSFIQLKQGSMCVWLIGANSLFSAHQDFKNIWWTIFVQHWCFIWFHVVLLMMPVLSWEALSKGVTSDLMQYPERGHCVCLFVF